MVYFQTDVTDSTASNFTPTIKVDDILSVVISADNPETAIPFNFPITNNINSANGYTTGNPERNGYLVDGNGNIHIPVVGKVHVAGLTRMEAVDQLSKTLEDYLKNPVVNLQIMNYKVTVLGDVKNPGTFKIPNERLTVLEAIGLAGDLKITGMRKNILVIRDIDGKKTQYRIDLTKTEEVFASPAYYLQQNDVVYVEPNLNEKVNGTFWRSTATIFTSIAAVILSTISILIRVK